MSPGDRAGHSRYRFLNASTQHDCKGTRSTGDRDGVILRATHAGGEGKWRNRANRIGIHDQSRRTRRGAAKLVSNR